MSFPFKLLLIIMYTVAEGKGHGSECNAIRELMMKASDLPEQMSADCNRAIEHIQWALDGHEQPEMDHARVYMAYSWPLLIERGYLDLLGQGRPEAIIILAYYGAMLHNCRKMWLVGQAGRHIVSLITKSLGAEWRPWLEWPNEVINSNKRPSMFNIDPDL